MAEDQGQTDRQRRQTEQRRRAKQLYDAAQDAGGVERALAQLDLAAIVRELASLADRIRGDLTQLGDVEALALVLAQASDLERAARGEMDAAQSLRAQGERERASAARERDEAVGALQTPKPNWSAPRSAQTQRNNEPRRAREPPPSPSRNATP
jgi:hypothetical protein